MKKICKKVRFPNTKPIKDYTKMVPVSETCKISMSIRDINQMNKLKSFGIREESIGSY